VKSSERLCCIVEARTESGSVPRKLIRDLDGTTLLDIALSKIERCAVIEHFYLAAEEIEIIDKGVKHGLNIVDFHWRDQLDYDFYVLIDPSFPFLGINTISFFVSHFLQTDNSELISVVEHRGRVRGQDSSLIADTVFIETQCLYGFGKQAGTNDLFVIDSKHESFFVEDEWHFSMAEDLWKSGW